MKDSPVAEEPDADARSLSLGDLRAEFPEQRGDIRPLDIGRNGMGEDQLKCLEVLLFHALVVPQSSTIVNDRG